MSDNAIGTEAAAQRLARKITAYWRDRGYDIRCRVTREAARRDPETGSWLFWDDAPDGIWVVRSDAVNGMPQRRLP